MTDNRNEMPIFTKTSDFLKWLVPQTNHFPRSHRHTVTRRLQDAALNFLERLVEANSVRGRRRAELLFGGGCGIGQSALLPAPCPSLALADAGPVRTRRTHGGRAGAAAGRLAEDHAAATGLSAVCCRDRLGRCAGARGTTTRTTCAAPTATTGIQNNRNNNNGLRVSVPRLSSAEWQGRNSAAATASASRIESRRSRFLSESGAALAAHRPTVIGCQYHDQPDTYRRGLHPTRNRHTAGLVQAQPTCRLTSPARPSACFD